ncbi:MAG: hypothetical protein FWF06_02970 [Symbiobacteriaceae bacterium]|nr:hypothetical protein [Symbiobacteriaceae bacterium]
MKTIKIVLLGYGHVGRSLTDLLLQERNRIAASYGLHFSLVAVADIQGVAFCPEGFPLSKLHTIAWDTGSVAYYPEYGVKGLSALEAVELSGADMLIEATPSNYEDAEPARSHVLQAFALGMDVVLANKGVLALWDHDVRRTASHYGKGLAYSCATSAGLEILPVLASLGQAGELLAIRGIFNATCQYTLAQMEQGRSLAEGVQEARQAGFAETDPTLDLTGMDSGVKLLHMANHAWQGGKSIHDVAVEGITKITPRQLAEAAAAGKRYSVVAAATWENGDYTMSVAPVALEEGDPLAGITYSQKVAQLTTVTQGEQVLYSRRGSGKGTAGSVLGDMLRLARQQKI